MLQQHAANAILPELGKAPTLLERGRSRKNTRHQGLHFGCMRNAIGIDINDDAAARVAATQSDAAIDIGIEHKQISTSELVTGTDAAKAGFRRGTGQQTGDGGDNAGRTMISTVAQVHLDAARAGRSSS